MCQMLLIRDITSLNVHSDYFWTKLFAWLCVTFTSLEQQIISDSLSTRHFEYVNGVKMTSNPELAEKNGILFWHCNLDFKIKKKKIPLNFFYSYDWFKDTLKVKNTQLEIFFSKPFLTD